jgi:hypothetical protein
MKDVLQENMSSIVYHFTSLSSLKNMIDFNIYVFSEAESSTDKACQPDGYPYYMSLTTQSSPYVGYAKKQNKGGTDELNESIIKSINKGRIKTPKDLHKYGDFNLSNIEKIIVKASSKKEDAMNTNDAQIDIDQLERDKTIKYVNRDGDIVYIIDKNSEHNRNVISQNSETEERIFSKERVLKNFFDYVIRIDIFPYLNNANVRISLDGNKLKKKYRSGSVDYLYNKYKEVLLTSSLNEGRTKNKASQIWEFLSDIFLPKGEQVGKESNDKFRDWGKKIFFHTSKKTYNVGLDMLKKYKQSSIKDYAALYGEMPEKHKKNIRPKSHKDYRTHPIELNNSQLREISDFICLILPIYNKDIENLDALYENLCKQYFSNITISYNGINSQLSDVLLSVKQETPKFFNRWISTYLSTLKIKTFDQKLRRINKSFTKGNSFIIADALKKMLRDFANLNNIEVTYITYLQKNRFKEVMLNKFPKDKSTKMDTFFDSNVSYFLTEEEIKEMVKSVIFELKKRNPTL